MEKLDLSKRDKAYYNPPAKPTVIELGEMPFVTLKGVGDPSSEGFAQATEALFTVAYTIKSICKKQDMDFAVPKLEGRWWVTGNKPGLEVPRSEWHYRLGILMPDFVTSTMFAAAQPTAVSKKKDLKQIQDVAFEQIEEGLCVTMMHIGPYATEPETMQQMRNYMSEAGLESYQPYHIEIYISDPRKTDPAKMKTILRFPVKKG
jgi:hypothetical protein